MKPDLSDPRAPEIRRLLIECKRILDNLIAERDAQRVIRAPRGEQ